LRSLQLGLGPWLDKEVREQFDIGIDGILVEVGDSIDANQPTTTSRRERSLHLV
jgi:hypothetical protein